MVSTAASRRFISFGTSSAMKLVMTTRGSCSTTWPSAMPSLSAVPVRCSGRRAAGSSAGPGDGGELARGDHLGEHHRGGLQRLLFLLGIGAPRPVLHHQHAERVAGAQHRHAEEGVVDLFAGLRPVGEGRMALGFREVDRVGLAGDQADQALVRAQHGLVHRLLVQAFGGVKLERAVDAQHVDGADLRHHVGGDQHHDLVEAFLRADRLRHHLAKPAQQHARTAERATHDVIPRTADAAGAPCPRRDQSQETVAARPIY